MKVLNSLFKDLTDEQKEKVLEFIYFLNNPTLPNEQKSLDACVLALLFLPNETKDTIRDLHRQEVEESYDEGYENGIQDTKDEYGI